MRLFVALDMDAGVLERLADFQKKLRRQTALSGREVKWVRPEQMHLTLKFLGAVEDKDITRVCAIVQETAARVEAFEMTCRGVGVFGRPARVVWAGVDGGKPLDLLQRQLDERFTQAGWPVENRAFSAHLTLCRVKSAAAGRVLAAAIAPFEQEVFGSVWADSVAVYESRLSSAGPEYSVVSRTMLIDD